MRPLFPNRRGEQARLVWNAEGERSGAVAEAPAETGRERQAQEAPEAKESADETWAPVAEKQSPEAFLKALDETLKGILPDAAAAEAIKKQLGAAYRADFALEEAWFFGEAEIAQARMDERIGMADFSELAAQALRRLEKSQKENMKLAREYAKEDRQAAEQKGKLEQDGEAGRLEAQAKLAKYIVELNDKYCNAKLAVPEGVGKGKYREAAMALALGMESRMQRQLEDLWEKAKAEERKPSAEELSVIRSGIESLYAQFAALNGDGHMIDAQEMARLRMMAYPDEQSLMAMLGSSEAEDLLALEAMALMNPELWLAKTERIAGDLMEGAIRGRNSETLIRLANQKSGAQPPIEKPGQAKRVLKEAVREAALRSPKEALDLIRSLDQSFHPEMEPLIKTYSPYALEYRQALLTGRVRASAPQDRVMVRYVAGSPKQQKAILLSKDRGELFRAIAVSQNQYKERWSQEHGDEEGEDRKKGADLGALIMLGAEAKASVEHWSDEADWKKMNLAEEMARTKVEGKILGGKLVQSPRKRGYNRSDLFRGGFNVIGLGISLGKAVGLAGAGINLAGAYSEASGSNPLERLGNAGINAAQSPGLWAMLGLTTFSRALELNPQYQTFEGNWKQKEVTGQLNLLKMRIGESDLRAFYRDPMEWEAMKELGSEARAAVVLGEGPERGGKIITKLDIEGQLTDSTRSRLHDETGRAEARYWFYKTFLDLDEPYEIHELKMLVTGDGSIESPLAPSALPEAAPSQIAQAPSPSPSPAAS